MSMRNHKIGSIPILRNGVQFNGRMLILGFSGSRFESWHPEKEEGKKNRKIKKMMHKKQTQKARQMHPYHQVDASPWPIQMAMLIQGTAMGVVSTQTHHKINLWPSFIGILIISILWWRDVLREAQGGFHTKQVQRGILIGFLLFLISEIMQFASFFWAFFHSSLAPSVELGGIWPPVGINPVNPWAIPLQGSCVLLGSGFVQTQAHHATIAGKKDQSQNALFWTIAQGTLFLILQYNEYTYGEFTISDSVFGSVFYCTTGLHALHVIVGVLFLAVSWLRQYVDSFTSEHHQGYEFAIYYFHLVDVVWQAVFFIYYVWGS